MRKNNKNNGTEKTIQRNITSLQKLGSLTCICKTPLPFSASQTFPAAYRNWDSKPFSSCGIMSPFAKARGSGQPRSRSRSLPKPLPALGARRAPSASLGPPDPGGWVCPGARRLAAPGALAGRRAGVFGLCSHSEHAGNSSFPLDQPLQWYLLMSWLRELSV